MVRKLLAVVGSAAICGLLLLFAGTPDGLSGQEAAQKKQAGDRPATQRAPLPPSAGIRNAPPQAEFVGRLMQAAREAGASVLSNGDSFDDFASVVETSDGTRYAAYAAYYDGHDQVRLHQQLGDGWWSTRSYVPLATPRPDIWMPQLAVDGDDRVWLVWCEQSGQTATNTGNWDLYARPFLGNNWGELVRLTTDPGPDINPHVMHDDRGRIHVVWQAHPNNNGDIHYCHLTDGQWSKPVPVTEDAASDWYPRAAVDSRGRVHVVFDSYRRGDYDVWLTSIADNQPGEVRPIAASGYYEAHASIACDPDDRLWICWEEGGFNWGKDQGHWLNRQNAQQGSTLGSTRQVRVACLDGDNLFAVPDVAESLPAGARNRPTAMAEVVAGDDGRIWLRFRRLVRGQQRRNRSFTKGWAECVSWLTSDGWAEPQVLPASAGRITVFSRAIGSPDGSLTVAYSADARAVQNYHRPIQDQALVFTVEKPDDLLGQPQLSKYQAPAPPAGIPVWNSGEERQQLAAIRQFRTKINGITHQIVRGDLHRHTELSWDVGPGNDGSYLDFYRYMIDVAAMDFGGLTDHQGGGHYPYWWWLTEKSADMYYLAPRFVPLYGYERSVRFPHGHRNVFHASRGVPVFPFQLRLGQQGVFPGVASGAVVDNDTKLLYEYLRRTGGIAISHTSGTSTMGTDWRDNDPEVEPVVEIYQGARNSYETEDGPRVHPSEEPPGRAPGGYQEAGLLWNAYAKGYRLGTTASSDHGSTHISYSMVFTPENDRTAILDAIRARQTYGATDNLIVDLRANGHFMGSEFATTEQPQLRLTITGTGPIARVDLVRNNRYIFRDEPEGATVELEYRDRQPVDGLNFYYFRVEQSDGEVAWSSPVWVNYRRP